MGWEGMDSKVDKETYWGDGNILYFDCVSSYMEFYSCQNSPNCTFK